MDREELNIIIERLWAKIRSEFATRCDVLKLAKELQRLYDAPTVNAVQSGVNGPIYAVGSDNTVHMKYEDWIEGETVDSMGNRQLTYNNSSNALSAAAAAMVIKAIRGEVSRLKNFNILICDKVDSDGHPVVPEISYSTLYLTPASGCRDEAEDQNWEEWIAVKKPEGSSSKFPFRWEHVGQKPIDLRWVKNDINGLNCSIKELEKKINRSSKILGQAILDRAIKPLEDLKNYIKSKEFIQYVLQELPRASFNSDGIMSQNTFTLLQMLNVWASNHHSVMGGGAMDASDVIAMLKVRGMDTSSLEDKYGKCPIDIVVKP